MSVLGLDSGYTVKYNPLPSGVPLGLALGDRVVKHCWGLHHTHLKDGPVPVLTCTSLEHTLCLTTCRQELKFQINSEIFFTLPAPCVTRSQRMEECIPGDHMSEYLFLPCRGQKRFISQFPSEGWYFPWPSLSLPASACYQDKTVLVIENIFKLCKKLSQLQLL